MDSLTINIIVVGIILIGIVAIFLNNIELASVALGGIVGFLSKQNITVDQPNNTLIDSSDKSNNGGY